MHHIQQAILELARNKNIYSMSLRELGRLATGQEQSPQNIKYHRDSLVRNGFLYDDNEKKITKGVIKNRPSKSEIVAIPIVGAASCGPATELAEEDISGFLHISKRFLPSDVKNVFAISAIGTSMNRANIKGKTIEDGDYILVDGRYRQPDNGDYVLAVTDGYANVKKIKRNPSTNQIALISESTENFPPIYIHEKDHLEFYVNGKVIDVLKSPNI